MADNTWKLNVEVSQQFVLFKVFLRKQSIATVLCS